MDPPNDAAVSGALVLQQKDAWELLLFLMAPLPVIMALHSTQLRASDVAGVVGWHFEGQHLPQSSPWIIRSSSPM